MFSRGYTYEQLKKCVGRGEWSYQHYKQPNLLVSYSCTIKTKKYGAVFKKKGI
jgi:hypothetical protein